MIGDLVGTVVGGKYQVRSKIGTGSMGDVYEATHGAQHVALKVLKVDDETLAARFLREAKTMSLFAHPHIVELLEVGTLDDGRLFFAAELVRGSTLRQLIEGGPIEPRRALAITRQILDALGHAHAMGVVHRDIKPENVMLAAGVDDGWSDVATDQVKILDFGVAKLIGDTPAVLGEGTLTITGYGALGTPYYISPEAVLGRPLDARADIYSIGVLLFEMLTGAPPYMHDDVAVLMRMHAAAPIPPLPDATPELALVVSEALAKKPELRFASAAEMIAAIDAAARSLEPLPVDTPPARAGKSTDVFGSLPLKAPAAGPPAAAAVAAPAASASPSRASAPPSVSAAPPSGAPASASASASIEPSASRPVAFAPSSIPSASQPVQPEPAKRPTRPNLPGVAPYVTPVAGVPAIPHAPPTASSTRGVGDGAPSHSARGGAGDGAHAAGGIAHGGAGGAHAAGGIAHGGAAHAAGGLSHAGGAPAGSPHLDGPVMGVVVPASGGHQSAPLFSPPMPMQARAPKPPHKLLVLAQQHKKLVIAGIGVFGVIILIAIIAAVTGGGGGGGKAGTTAAKTESKDTPAKRPDLVRGAQELIAAGHPSRAAEMLEREEIADDAETWIVLGHARVGAGRRLDGLAAYERALKLDKKLAADATLRANVGRVLETRDAVAGVVALELAMRLEPPAKDLVKQLAASGKVGDVRRRAMAIAEREKMADGIDRVESWSLDLAQAANCEERLAAVVKLRRSSDPRAIPALKRAKTHRCVEREVAEAIAYLESRPATPSPQATP